VVGERALQASELASGGENRYLSVRSRWFDQTVDAHASQMSQVVNLGQVSTLARFRLTLPPSLRWFEIDLPGVFDRKEPALADLHCGANLRSDRCPHGPSRLLDGSSCSGPGLEAEPGQP